MLSNAQQNPYLPVYQTIDVPWSLRQAPTGKDTDVSWFPTHVPITVHNALKEIDFIVDPYYRDNEERLQWIDSCDWEFQSTFEVSEEMLNRKHVELVFKGLDTYVHVFLNDSLILEANNMFRTWSVEVKKYLKPGSNRLHLYFDSPIKRVDNDWKNLGYELPGGIRTMTRKAQFHYGWDWGPKFVGFGILQKPVLRAWDDILFEDVFFTTLDYTPERARIVARIRYRSEFDGPATLVFKEGRRKSIENRRILPGVHEDSITYELDNPKLWWCVGLGEPHLYQFTVQMQRNGNAHESFTGSMGIRKVELVTDKDKDGKGQSFYFKLNGMPIFAKGVNYIPQDMFQDCVTPERYDRLIQDVLDANMNMLRVWGGGIYEDDLFYQRCDEKGLLVWQDFMYACALYPGNGRFLKNAAREALDQIERLRQHPCLALWCGNNENNEAWHHWGWQMNFNEAQREQLWRDYRTLFQDLLETYVVNYGGGVPYWESSPKHGRANPKSDTEGDAHFWGVWHDETPFSAFDKRVPRFMSEYGFQSFPEWRTIQAFTIPEDRRLDSKVMLLHQKHPRGNALIAEYMKRDFRDPKSFEDFVYVSQLLQAEGMRTGIEAHRRNKPYCMGTLYWQLNDVWPVASWSSIDYYGRWKALHYYVREAYRPVAVLPYLQGETLQVFGVSDLLGDTTVDLSVRTLNFDGAVLTRFDVPNLPLRPDASSMLWQMDLKNLLKGGKPTQSVVELQLKNKAGDLLSRRLFYAQSPRKLKLPNAKVNFSVEAVSGGYLLLLETDQLAKNVMISTEKEGFFDDNYFDLLPGERKSVLFKTSETLEEPAKAFSVKHLEQACN